MLRRLIDQLAMTVAAKDVERTLSSIARLVPEYRPAGHEDGDLAAPTPRRLDQPELAEPGIVTASLPSAG